MKEIISDKDKIITYPKQPSLSKLVKVINDTRCCRPLFI